MQSHRRALSRALYGASTYFPAGADENVFGIMGCLDEFASHTDQTVRFLRLFQSAAAAAMRAGGDSISIQYTGGDLLPDAEHGNSPPFRTDGNMPKNTNEPYSGRLGFVLSAHGSASQTISTYGDDERTAPSNYAHSMCRPLAQLGAQGVSVFFSGSGAGSCGSGSCARTTTRTANRSGHPELPSLLPVRDGRRRHDARQPGVAASLSIADISDSFTRPSYQVAAVKAFMQTSGSKDAGCSGGYPLHIQSCGSKADGSICASTTDRGSPDRR
ncbi:hypothetical protein BC834DRAFT_973716 [Gloeopeniophorella convolvens]|nr:hypothetical protein BC834DRAFT_973716 [Gloeopeniophorella convolvens]